MVIRQQHTNWISLGAIILTSLVVAITVFQDYIHSVNQDHSFYISESLTFKSFWLFFIPLIFALSKIFDVIKTEKIHSLLLKSVTLLFLTVATHILVFAFSVKLISYLFLEHTYELGQVFRYVFSELLIILILVYSGYSMWYLWPRKSKIINEEIIDFKTNIKTLVVKRGTRNELIDVNRIKYIVSEKPYIAIHTSDKKSLYNSSLKEIESKLPDDKFIRIHKSTIINFDSLTKYTSRSNGDYDIHLKDGVKLRLSRTYSKDFFDYLKS